MPEAKAGVIQTRSRVSRGRAYLGGHAIPSEWIETIQNRDLLVDLGRRMATKATIHES